MNADGGEGWALPFMLATVQSLFPELHYNSKQWVEQLSLRVTLRNTILEGPSRGTTATQTRVETDVPGVRITTPIYEIGISLLLRAAGGALPLSR